MCHLPIIKIGQGDHGTATNATNDNRIGDDAADIVTLKAGESATLGLGEGAHQELEDSLEWSWA